MKKFDKEYSTSWIKEKDFLASKGIKYVFVKRNNEIDTWKYIKNFELFNALSEFYKLNN